MENYPEYIPPPGVQAGPGFPNKLNDEWSNMFFGSGVPTNGETATAYILDEKNAGVALSKRNSGGSFSKLGATKIGDGSDATYTETNCNN